MVIGVPKEIKTQEARVALLPSAAYQLIQRGHKVLVEKNAGVGSGYPDKEYEQAGAQVVPNHADAFAAELVVKVKEPLPAEYALLRKNQILFTYLHLAADLKLTEALIASGVTGVTRFIPDEHGGAQRVPERAHVGVPFVHLDGQRAREHPLDLVGDLDPERPRRRTARVVRAREAELHHVLAGERRLLRHHLDEHQCLLPLLLGRLAGGAIFGAVQAAVFVAVLWPFGAEVRAGVPGFVVLVLAGMLVAYAVGALMSSVALRTGSAEAVQGSFPLLFILLFLSSAFFPRETMSGAYRTIADVNPVSHMVEGQRALAVSGAKRAAALNVSRRCSIGVEPACAA